MMKYILILFFVLGQTVRAQDLTQFQVHSHNDYYRNIPFWNALASGATSIEADVFLKNEGLYVAHSEDEIQKDRSLEALYIKPLQQSVSLGAVTDTKLQLLIDIKSEAYSTLEAITNLLEKYPALTKHGNISFVISGNRPKPEEYVNYPEFILFDYQSLDPINDKRIADKIALVSLSFGKFSKWNGLGRLTKTDSTVVVNTIKMGHALKKPFRFWGTPDTKTAWQAFASMGIDFINTDKPYDCFDYLKDLDNRTFSMSKNYSEVYMPTFVSDGAQKPVKNIILLIGDGNGLSQITATQQVNKGNLSVTQLKSIGLIKTQAADDFTTDSAAGATAMATGQKTNNRAIGTDKRGKKIANLTEILSKKGYSTGIITTDEATGATPSSFYAHQVDRSQTEDILKDLFKSSLNLVISKGDYKDENNGFFKIAETPSKVGQMPLDRTAFFYGDDTYGTAPTDFLATLTLQGLIHLNQEKRPFFLMVEGANIDSYGHKNSVEGIVSEGISFDKAISEALKFADQEQNTLVIITADHETSGFSLPHGSNNDYSIEGDFASTDHSGSMVPLFAYGPQSREFAGVYDNHMIFQKILQVLKVTLKE